MKIWALIYFICLLQALIPDLTLRFYFFYTRHNRITESGQFRLVCLAKPVLITALSALNNLCGQYVVNRVIYFYVPLWLKFVKCFKSPSKYWLLTIFSIAKNSNSTNSTQFGIFNVKRKWFFRCFTSTRIKTWNMHTVFCEVFFIFNKQTFYVMGFLNAMTSEKL